MPALRRQPAIADQHVDLLAGRDAKGFDGVAPSITLLVPKPRSIPCTSMEK
jgi:hypothetical protein